MPTFIRQVWTLVKKDLLVAGTRRPISTTIRAVVLPLAIVLIISYAQYFLNPPQHFGIGRPIPVLSLSDAISTSSGGRNSVAFVDNGLTGGEISAVIEDVIPPFRKAGKSVHRTANETDLKNLCPSSPRGTTSCFGAVVFRSSPNEPVKGGVWNYTIRSDRSLGGTFDVRSSSNDAQVYLLPLQRAIDQSISSHMSPPNQGALQDVEQYLYTKESEEKRVLNTRESYFNAGIYYFGVVFFLGMVGVVYQMTGLIASERERGLSQLLDAMMPNAHRWQPQVARLLAHHIAFSIIYLPSWLATGIVLASVVFIKTAAAITVYYHLTVGLALCSYALVGAAFFKKAQLSGIIMIIITVVLAVIPQVLSDNKQTAATVLALSLIFPSSNYTYFISFMSRWEFQNMPTNLSKTAPQSPWKLHGLVLWLFLLIQILVYPVFAAIIERTLFGTSSKKRTVHSQYDPNGPTVCLRSFSKTYRQHWLLRIFWKKKVDVNAVKALDLDARKGQILMLLGPNGSGKSTTLDAIAGLSKPSSGTIDIDGAGGLGIAPQKNVLWLLTPEILPKTWLAWWKRATWFEKGMPSQKKLSGGQKRKLQLAMMFAGGSSVCCVDEVSSGLDPLSRRKIWDILLAERGNRTIIMTTHFLDEADFLSDHIAILSTGQLKAIGPSAALKHQYGEGYSIHVSAGTSAPLIQGLKRVESLEGTTYSGLDSMDAIHAVEHIERAGINDFRVSGPTLEDVFLKLAGNPLHVESSEDVAVIGVTREKPKNDNTRLEEAVDRSINLHYGRHISPWRQGWILYRKRWTIFRRNYVPMISVMITALIGAGVCPLFLKYRKPLSCSIQSDTSYSSQYSSYTESLATNFGARLVGGPSDQITDESLANLADIYSINHTRYGNSAFDDETSLKDSIATASTYADFTRQIALGNATIQPGGFWLGDVSSKPTFAWSADHFYFANSLEVQNVLHNVLLNGSVSTSFSEFDIPPSPRVYDFGALLFIIYYSLVLCLYPGLYALYPTVERLRNVRALQYSNGVRSLPLWLAYAMFDLGFTLVISVISTILLSVGTKLWYHLPYLFLILLLYGISSSILGYLISKIARSQLAAWSFCTSGQVVLCLAYLGAYLGVQSNVPIGDLTSTLDKVHFSLGLVSPVANVMRSLFVSLNQFTLLCGDTSNPGAIKLYGGPILYLILQIFVFFGILLWWDSRVPPLAFIRKEKEPSLDAESASNAASKEVTDEITRVKQSLDGLRILHLSKSFGRYKAVDDISFKVDQGEIFALLGPNGAGKSTAISLVRGDIPPSPSSQTSIHVCSTSALTHRALARANLGVCPQFTASDTLTVAETLDFYAKVRGATDPTYNIDMVIDAFGLESYRHRLTHKLSGGTKRRLSLAIALVGNPAVLLLDEPSSGLDAAAKRSMWKALKSLSQGRSIVLTTHSMEEADALADRAGIMSSRMLTVGEVRELRSKWGEGWSVQVVLKSAPLTTAQEMEGVKGWVREYLREAVVEEKTCGGLLRFVVPSNGSCGEHVGIGRLFGLLEGNKEALGIEYYSIGQTTMDEVFVNIVRRHGGEEENRGDYGMSRRWWKRA
ncbi:MAG: hypothetical protein Q9222_004698 [Ikaeria aurantiellina]